jgi:hypothetical protein
MRRTALLAFLCVPLVGCAATYRYVSETPENAPYDSVRGLEEDYSTHRHERFFERFEASSFPRYAEFQLAIRDRFKRDPYNIPLQMDVDEVQWRPDDVVVKVHWVRRASDGPAKGKCTFIFDTRSKPAGDFLLLKSIGGDSPF